VASPSSHEQIARAVSGTRGQGHHVFDHAGAVNSATPAKVMTSAWIPITVRNHNGIGVVRGGSEPGARSCSIQAIVSTGGTAMYTTTQSHAAPRARPSWT
jgi:hypothetical protein